LCNGDPYLRTAAAGDNRAISLDLAALVANANEQYQRQQAGESVTPHPAPPSRASTDLAGRDSATDTDFVSGLGQPVPVVRPGLLATHSRLQTPRIGYSFILAHPVNRREVTQK
jgi:hypothetical protein